MKHPSLMAGLLSLLIAGGAAARERPAPPAQHMPDLPNRAACAHRASRDALLADAGARINQAFDTGLILTAYARDLAAWTLEDDQLAPPVAAALAARYQAEASASGVGAAEDAANAEFITATEAFDDARNRGRPREACLALVDVLGAINHVVEAAEGRWAFLAERYQTHRGVTLD